MAERLAPGWFSEVNDMWKGQAMSLAIKKMLVDERSKFQHIQLFESTHHGKVLILDDVIQLTEHDECAYHEMFSHIGCFAHPNPKRVLVVGGGDGGILREVGRHASVEEMVICDLDERVGQLTRKHIPSVGCGYDDHRVRVHVEDANDFLDRPEYEGYFDVILSDTSDPVGPAEQLFEAPFYGKMAKCLAPGGVALTQAENIWLEMELIERLIRTSGKFFVNIQYALTHVPTYPSGTMGFLVCKKEGGDGQLDCSIPRRPVPASFPLKYYSSGMHASSFHLPMFAERTVEKARLDTFGFNKYSSASSEEKAPAPAPSAGSGPERQTAAPAKGEAAAGGAATVPAAKGAGQQAEEEGAASSAPKSGPQRKRVKTHH